MFHYNTNNYQYNNGTYFPFTLTLSSQQEKLPDIQVTRAERPEAPFSGQQWTTGGPDQSVGALFGQNDKRHRPTAWLASAMTTQPPFNRESLSELPSDAMLRAGEMVKEMGVLVMHGTTGVVYRSPPGCLCIYNAFHDT